MNSGWKASRGGLRVPSTKKWRRRHVYNQTGRNTKTVIGPLHIYSSRSQRRPLNSTTRGGDTCGISPFREAPPPRDKTNWATAPESSLPRDTQRPDERGPRALDAVSPSMRPTRNTVSATRGPRACGDRSKRVSV